MAALPAIFAEFERESLPGRPVTAGRHAAEIGRPHRDGVAKAEIARRPEIGRASVRRVLAGVTQ